jgi:molybdate transport system substrate-binding protein
LTRLAALAVTAALLGGCAGGDEAEGELVIFAASSLSEVAPDLDPDSKVVTGGSNDLAAQIRDGAKVDVFLSASAKPLADLREDGLVDAPVPFASNRLVIIVPRANRAGIDHLSDLTRKGIKLVLGAAGVPVGDYARTALEAAGLGAAFDNVVSLEDDVKGVVAKVALDEADAGVVYATDARAAGEEVRTVKISAYFQPEIRYYAAAVAPASERAREFLEHLTGDDGQRALRRAGFLPVPP